MTGKQPTSPSCPARHATTYQQPPAPSQVPPAHANAPTYVDYPLPKLRTAVPALNGMKPGTSQDELASILARAGEATLNSLSRVPNLSSLEDVYSAVMSRAAGPANSVLGMEESPALLDVEAQLHQTRSVEFNYLLLFDHHPDGATAIRNCGPTLRTGRSAHPSTESRRMGLDSPISGCSYRLQTNRNYASATWGSRAWTIIRPSFWGLCRSQTRSSCRANSSGPARKKNSSSRESRGSTNPVLMLFAYRPIFYRRSQA